jgi:hypothetical protein
MDENKLMQIFGTTELVSLFEEMNKDIQTNILNKSFRKASKLIIDEAKNNLRGSYKHVAESMGETFKKDIQTLNVGSIKKKGGYLAHIANKGTKERAYKDKNGQMHKTGKIIGNYFWDNAINSTEGNVEEVIYKDIKDRFEKLVQKKNSK